MQVDSSDIWKLIPPEEKFEMMARAHAKATFTCIITFVVACTLAIGLQFSWLMWASFLGMPFIFQFAAGKAWRFIRPMIMLEYLAARSAARRYAFATKAKDLSLVLMFRGEMERQFEGDEGQLKALEASIESTNRASVWVALFTDAVVLMSEKPGGASVEFSHLLNENLKLQGHSPSGQGDYASDREVSLSYIDRRSDQPIKVRLQSRYAASMVVFEKKLIQLQSEWHTRQDQAEALESLPFPEQDMGQEDY